MLCSLETTSTPKVTYKYSSTYLNFILSSYLVIIACAYVDEVDAANARVAQESQSAWRMRNRFSTRVEKEMPASSSAPILLSLRDPSSESYRGDAFFTLANTAASSSAEGWTEALSSQSDFFSRGLG